MSSRDKILNAVKAAQPDKQPLPDLSAIPLKFDDAVAKFIEVLSTIGATVKRLPKDRFQSELMDDIGEGKNVVNTISEFVLDFASPDKTVAPQTYDNLDYSIIPGQLGVAENGAIWVTDTEFQIRALPFICEHLILVISAETIVHNMHEAYDKIGIDNPGFGAFIAGPSKTADIEQSLVLGAHGPRFMTAYVLE
ncbi:LutC/YkgG family protein [Polluticaenibacter yanchengensis]|uniref:LUD domain-containing protein n=1 Tax=Polluticaenibacter yanchengensis TaxID=3014562 RepID=A0ABT4UNJ4_9BACT|nr:LUD domain-containing protein [Chitinophagaceae bacterium LY-5]